MKLFTGWVASVGLIVAATAANAQMPAPYGIGSSPYTAVSDFGGPYAELLPEAPPPRYGYATAMLPLPEVYAIVRESGFLPLGIPQQRGLYYTIAVTDGGGEDGRLVIDARTGRILRFVPVYRVGDNFNDDLTITYGPGTYGPVGPPPVSNIRGVPRPPGLVPNVASRTPPVPKPSPLTARPAAEPAQQSAAMQPKPAAPLAAPQSPAQIAAEAKPAQQILPTQSMPKMQGLE